MALSEKRRIFLSHRTRVRRKVVYVAGLVLMGLVVCTTVLVDLAADHHTRNSQPHELPPLTDEYSVLHRPRRSLQQLDEEDTTVDGAVETTTVDPKAIPEQCKALLPNPNATGGGQFPQDVFTMKQLRQGAIILHSLGLVYMFVALAIVCDEFFVPALGVITEKFEISDDVAGATFMAAGGSAPEFFTSVIGVFISSDNVGIGTIVGSATFNILCVLAFCCLFSLGVLHLTWWPLFRDVSFYVIALACVVYFFLDEKIMIYEALILFFIYILYCTFMKYNERLEMWTRRNLLRQQIPEPGEADAKAGADGDVAGAPAQTALGNLMMGRSSSGSFRRTSVPILHSGARFRNGIVQLMVHTLDPLSELHIDDKHVQLQGTATVRVVLDRNAIIRPAGDSTSTSSTSHANPSFSPDIRRQPPPAAVTAATADAGVADVSDINAALPDGEDGEATGEMRRSSSQRRRLQQQGGTDHSLHKLDAVAEGSSPHRERADTAPQLDQQRNRRPKQTNTGCEGAPLLPANAASNANGRRQEGNFEGNAGPSESGYQNAVNGQVNNPQSAKNEEGVAGPDDEDEEEPLDISWPDDYRKRLTYVILAPIVFPLWVTLPDVRKPQSRRWFPITFIGSILWIAFFSYLMVWWANTLGETLSIPVEIMGLTILAAGTSIPDLITSVIVARKGLGDMAVSSSVGSNIFDVCVGMPIPWLLKLSYQYISGNVPKFISVLSKGLVCSVGMLFVMLVVLVVSIGLSDWKMNKAFGFIMIGAYCVFVVISVCLEKNIVACPLKMSQCADFI